MKFKKLTRSAVTPVRTTDGSAGYDLATIDAVWIESEDTAWIRTGLAVEIPEGYVGLLNIRSSIGKAGVSLTNSVGIIDSDYRGELQAYVHNRTLHQISFHAGQPVLQLVIVPCLIEAVELTTNLSTTTRGNGGFGSTNTKETK